MEYRCKKNSSIKLTSLTFCPGDKVAIFHNLFRPKLNETGIFYLF